MLSSENKITINTRITGDDAAISAAFTSADLLSGRRVCGCSPNQGASARLKTEQRFQREGTRMQIKESHEGGNRGETLSSRSESRCCGSGEFWEFPPAEEIPTATQDAEIRAPNPNWLSYSEENFPSRPSTNSAQASTGGSSRLNFRQLTSNKRANTHTVELSFRSGFKHLRL